MKFLRLFNGRRARKGIFLPLGISQRRPPCFQNVFSDRVLGTWAAINPTMRAHQLGSAVRKSAIRSGQSHMKTFCSFRGMLGFNPAVLERHNPGGLRPTLINTTITQGHQGSAPPPSRPTRLLTTARWPLTERARLLCSTPVVQVKPTAAAHGSIRSAQRTPLGSTPA